MFFETPTNIDFAGYTDENLHYKYSSNIENVLDTVQGALEKMFSTNQLVGNAWKCHFLISPKTPVDIHISNTKILNDVKANLLGVNFEGTVNFDFHMKTVFKKACKNISLLQQYTIT